MAGKRDRIIKTMTGTAAVDPDDYSAMTSASRWQSLGYALAGCLYMLRRQKNVRIQIVATVVVIGLALWVQIGAVRWAILVLAITLVWMAEFINAAVEAVVNLASPELHPMAKVSKDVAAAAVLLAVLASVAVGLLILGPPLLDKLR